MSGQVEFLISAFSNFRTVTIKKQTTKSIARWNWCAELPSNIIFGTNIFALQFLAQLFDKKK
jgi:hypothetical protein